MPRFILSAPNDRLLPCGAILLTLVLVLACTPKGQTGTPAAPPYFVTIKHDKAWGRRGPSFEQPVLWEYRQRGLPMLVVDEIPLWSQVRDWQGETIWMSKTLLSHRPMVLIIAKKPAPLYRTAGGDQSIIAYADPGAILRLGQCLKTRCALSQGNIRGWAEKSALWGIDARAALKATQAVQ